MPVSIANTGLRLRSDIASPASRKLTWLSAMMTFGPGLVQILEALHLDAEEGAVDDRQRIAKRARRHGVGDRDGDDEIGDAESA